VVLSHQFLDPAEPRLLRFGVEARFLFPELLLEGVVLDLMLRGDLGGRFAGHLAANLPRFDERDPLTLVLEEPRGRDTDDPAANDGDVDVDIPYELWKARFGGGGVPVGAGFV